MPVKILCLPLAMIGRNHNYAEEAPLGLGFEWPTLELIGRVLLLQDYNTRLVVLSTLLLGLSCGLIGTYLLLRKRSLMSDALAHSTLPGIGLAFMFMVLMGGDGKYLPGLLLGATIFGCLGCLLVLLIRNLTRIKDDAAMGIVLSVFFGLGVAVLGVVQNMPTGSAAGLEYFIYGKAASMVLTDFWLLASIALVVFIFSVLLFKEFRLLCFDETYAATRGWPIHLLDVVMLLLVTLSTVAGLQSVGLILIIAFLIIPAAAARFWTEKLSTMLLLSGIIGAISGWLGATASALTPNLPAGAVIVLVAAFLFILSMFFGKTRGILQRVMKHQRLRKKVEQQHLLRAVFEISEQSTGEKNQITEPIAVQFSDLLTKRSWTAPRLRKIIRQTQRQGYVASFSENSILLNDFGFYRATQVARNHRLWEIYLIRYADIAPSHVDRDADAVEHILGDELVAELEAALDGKAEGQSALSPLPTSPHAI